MKVRKVNATQRYTKNVKTLWSGKGGSCLCGGGYKVLIQPNGNVTKIVKTQCKSIARIKPFVGGTSLI